MSCARRRGHEWIVHRAGLWPVRITIAILGIFLTATTAVAQNSNYWTEQFGNRAYLLSGAVVADPADVSAVFYNPGGLALNEETQRLLAGLGVEFSGLLIRDAVAPGEDLSTTSTSFIPSMIAGEIPTEREGHRFAYSVLTRRGAKLRGFAKSVLPGDAVDLPALDLVSNSLQLDTNLNEYWAGGSWAYRARPDVGIGASLFLAVRNQRSQIGSFFQTLSSGNRAAVIDTSGFYDFRHWRLLAKIGAVGKIADWRVGLAVTTPSLGLWGDGDRTVNATAVGQAVDPDGEPLTLIATDIQEGLPADYRSPFSIAAGASRRFGDTTLHLSAEWFQAVELYDILAAEPFTAQTGDLTVDPTVSQEIDSVFNVAVGAEYEFGGGTKTYLGFHTDFAGAGTMTAAQVEPELSGWDFYHFSGGVTFDIRGSGLTLGANLGLASDTIDDPFAGSPLPVGLPNGAGLRVHRLTVILGVDFLSGALGG